MIFDATKKMFVKLKLSFYLKKIRKSIIYICFISLNDQLLQLPTAQTTFRQFLSILNLQVQIVFVRFLAVSLGVFPVLECLQQMFTVGESLLQIMWRVLTVPGAEPFRVAVFLLEK